MSKFTQFLSLFGFRAAAVPTTGGECGASGALSARIVKMGVITDDDRKALPKAPLAWQVRNFLFHILADAPRLAVAYAANFCGVPVIITRLYAVKIGADGRKVDYGLLSTRVVTTVGVGFLVDAWQNIVEMEIMKYHGCGTGTNAESSADTALQTECTTALNPDSTRATGSLGEGASANIFSTVGTLTFDASAAVTEHGLLSQAATGGGVLWDRSVFSAINVVSADSIQFTYQATFPAGS